MSDANDQALFRVAQAASAAVRADPGEHGLGDEARAACARFAEAAFATALADGRPGFESFVAGLGRDGARKLADSGLLTHWIYRGGNASARSPMRTIAALRASLTDAHDVAVRATIEGWQEKSSRGADTESRVRTMRTMAALVTAAADLRSTARTDTIAAFADAMYPRGASPEAGKASDMAAAALMAVQSRGEMEAPFVNGFDAVDFHSALEARSPDLARRTQEAVSQEAAAARSFQAAPGADAPARREPERREVHGRVWRTWTMEVSGREVRGRDPFDGPAVEEMNRDGSPGAAAFLWKGERLGSDLGTALESMREIDPDGYAACARRYAEEVRAAGTDPAALPGPLREVVESLMEPVPGLS